MRFYLIEEFINGSWQPGDSWHKFSTRDEAVANALNSMSGDKMCGRKVLKRKVLTCEVIRTYQVLLKRKRKVK